MSKEKYNNIICFGEVLWDMLPSGAQPGGAPLNVAIHLNRQKIHPVLVSKVGKDTEGEELLEFISRSGLSASFVQTDITLPTSKVLVTLDESKNATYEICEPVAWDNIQFTPDLEKAAAAADLIIFGSLASRSNITRNTLFQLLESSAAKRLLDVNLRPPYDKPGFVEELLQLSDFIKLNDDELKIIAGWNLQSGDEKQLVSWMAKNYQCETICVTRGANGALLFTENNFYEHPGFSVKAIDTVGAGDSFLAGLITHLSKNVSRETALEHACATGALVASKPGAVPSYSLQEIEKLKMYATGR